MNEQEKSNPAETLCAEIRLLRQRYDNLGRGEVATLRRCRTADEVALDGTFWRVSGPLAQQPSRRRLPHVVLLFPNARHVTRERFSFGRFLKNRLGDGDGASLRVRRLLDSRDPDDLDHRLRGVLRLACADNSPVDWGVLGKDIMWFFAESGAVRRQWAQDFYAPISSRPELAPPTV